jgi:hypothetical protein
MYNNHYFKYDPKQKAEYIKAALELKAQGMTIKKASQLLQVKYETLKGWVYEYNNYITTGELGNRGISNALPYLEVNNLELFDRNTKPAKKEVKKEVQLIEVEQPKKITILWGLITIN